MKLEFGPLILEFDPLSESREPNGLLTKPAKLFVRWFNEEQMRWEEEPISFGAAGTLAPALRFLIRDRLAEYRSGVR